MKIQVGDQVFHTPEKLSHVHDAQYDASMLKPSRVVGAVIPAEQTISDRDCTKFSEEDLAQMRNTVLTKGTDIVIGTALQPSCVPLDVTSTHGLTYSATNFTLSDHRIQITAGFEDNKHIAISKSYIEQLFNRGVDQLRQSILEAATKLKPETKAELKALLDQVDIKFEE